MAQNREIRQKYGDATKNKDSNNLRANDYQ